MKKKIILSLCLFVKNYGLVDENWKNKNTVIESYCKKDGIRIGNTLTSVNSKLKHLLLQPIIKIMKLFNWEYNPGRRG